MVPQASPPADQVHDEIDPDLSILKYFSNGAFYWSVGPERIYIPGYLDRLLFDMETVKMPVGKLSGGERNRLALAKKLLRGGNFLVLDEPTNDLDLSTLRLLEETIIGNANCALIVSHDRYFLNRVCTHLLVFDDAARVTRISGNYDDYLLYRERSEAGERTDRRNKASRKRKGGASPVDKRAGVGQSLTWREKQELAAIEDTIEENEAELAYLEKCLNAPGFYQQDHEHVRRILEVHGDVQARVDRLYARWEDLERRKSGNAEESERAR